MSLYGLMYLIAAGLIWVLARHRPPVTAPGRPSLSAPARDRLLVWTLVGAIIGGRLGYVLIYEPGYYLAAPWEIPRLWRGGMSFHGGLMGVMLSVAWTTRRDRAFFWPALDLLALLAPFGLALGRLGSFLIGELWGRPGDLPWAVVFPGAGPEPRHPTQLYEALVEGPLLALLVLKLSRRARPGLAAAGFAVFYSLGRLMVEFWRVPDPAWGYLAGDWLTMGQALSLGLGAAGLFLLWRLRIKEKTYG